MMMTDIISDMLTRIRNAIIVKADKVDIPASRLKIE
ncbi:MAG: 30S ribosomal protein S8, partial [Thermodesulfovibrionales bacterium]|nr:30S ribosomal protein S8 [Thermodesulfovibrionales bacterium]